MKRGFTVAISMCLILGLAFGAVLVEASPATIVVPDDQPTIQQGADAADPGDTVLVRAGTYYEHVVIDKSLTLQGEGRDMTTIDGGGDGVVIHLEADHVTIAGLTVINGRRAILVHGSEAVVITNNRFFQHYEAAVSLVDSNNVILDGNEIHDSQFGASTSQISNTLIANNEVHHNDLAGIYTSNSHELVVAGNKVHHHSSLEGGIRVSWGSDGVIVERNCVYANRRGIALANDAANSIVRDNIVWQNDEGIYGSPSCINNAIYHNDLIDNTVQAWARNSWNTWDDGYPSGGNYWSDYSGVDNFSGPSQNVPGSDGMGDTPYTFSGDQDNYPLMEARHVVPVDIIPTLCPNRLNVRNKGVLRVAILGTDSFDATQVDPSTITLQSVAPIRWAIKDVAAPYSPYMGKESCQDCTRAVPDGYSDLTLDFDAEAILDALGEVEDGDCVKLTITGRLKGEFGGSPIIGEDLVSIIKKGRRVA